MASFIYSIPSVERTITRPVTITILRQVLDIAGINPKDFRTKMVGVAEQEKVQNGYLQNTEDEEDDFDKDEEQTEDKIDIKPNRLSTDKKLTLEVEEEIVGDLTTPVRYHDHKPVFVDEALKIIIKPVYSDIQSRISVVLNVRDKVEAHNWLQEVKRKLYQSAIATTHTIDYYYIIPPAVMKGLFHIHTRRESLEGYNESFGEYIAKCFDERYDILTNMSNTNHICTIREKQVNVLGFFDFDFEPEKPEKEDDKAGGWNIRFTYTVRYQRPDNVVFDYPLMVHQQMVPDSMIVKKRPEHYSTYNHYRGLTGEIYHKLAVYGNKHGMIIPEGIPEPIFDDWIPNWAPEGYIQLARILLQVDPNDKYWVTDITDFAETFAFKENMLRWFRQRQHKVLKHKRDPFYFTVYDDTTRLSDDQLLINDELKITTKEPMSLRKMYHVVHWVLYDLSQLDPEAWLDLLNNCDILHEWLEAIAPNTGVEQIRCNLDNTVNIDDFKKWWEDNPAQAGFTLPLYPGLPWADCIGSYCRYKDGWDPDGGRKGNDPNNWAKKTDYKTTGHFGIIAFKEKRE